MEVKFFKIEENKKMQFHEASFFFKYINFNYIILKKFRINNGGKN